MNPKLILIGKNDALNEVKHNVASMLKAYEDNPAHPDAAFRKLVFGQLKRIVDAIDKTNEDIKSIANELKEGT